MKKMFTIELAILLALGFVPNEKKRYHAAYVTIGGHTVWTKDLRVANKIATRVLTALNKRGIDAQYCIEDLYGNYMKNW